jgi:hypothetical protein
MKIHIYYRHASENRINPYRPKWFSYEKCFQNLLKTIEGYDFINLTLSIDGDINQDFTRNYKDKFTLFSTNYQSSLLSYRDLLKYIKEQPMEPNDLIYFLENDYLHVDNWVDKILELYSTFSNLDYISLYDHNDKYFPEHVNELISIIYVTNTHHWRTITSTCGSFIITRNLFEQDFDVWINAIGDHPTFMYLNEYKNRSLLTPIPGLSTHCMETLMSPTINWEEINNKINL